MNNTIKNEILEHISHWKDVPNGVAAKKIFEALCQEENRNKEEFNIEDLCQLADIDVTDGVIFGTLPILTGDKKAVLDMYHVYKDLDGRELKIDFRNQTSKYKYGRTESGLMFLEFIEHPETGEIIYNPEERMYFRFSLSDNFKSMLQTEEETVKPQSHKKTTQKP